MASNSTLLAFSLPLEVIPGEEMKRHISCLPPTVTSERVTQRSEQECGKQLKHPLSPRFLGPHRDRKHDFSFPVLTLSWGR